MSTLEEDIVRKGYEDWDNQVNTAKGHVYIHTRQKGDIPGCIPEAQPLSKDQKFMDKYHLGPNDPQWLFDMISEQERDKYPGPPPYIKV